jgi:hypothetical protein
MHSAPTQVKFPDSSIQPALAPFVSLINHSPWPHIVHFSTVNPKTRTLDLTTFRPVQQEQQVYLSYGPLRNLQLLLFYGFAVEGNPFEEAMLTVRWPNQQQQQGGVGSKEAVLGLLQQLGLWPHHHHHQQQFMLTVQQPLPSGLLPCLRLMSATAEEVTAVRQSLLQHQQQQGASAGNSSSSSSDRGKRGNKAKQAGKGSSRDEQRMTSSSSSTEEGPSTPAELQAAWAAAATWQAVLGTPLSVTNEAAAQQHLQQLLAAAKQPYEACMAKIAKRRQLQVLLQQRQQQQQQGAVGVAGSSSSSSSSSEEASFLQGLETLCKGIVGLYDACGTAAAACGTAAAS